MNVKKIDLVVANKVKQERIMMMPSRAKIQNRSSCRCEFPGLSNQMVGGTAPDEPPLRRARGQIAQSIVDRPAKGNMGKALFPPLPTYNTSASAGPDQQARQPDAAYIANRITML